MTFLWQMKNVDPKTIMNVVKRQPKDCYNQIEVRLSLVIDTWYFVFASIITFITEPIFC